MNRVFAELDVIIADDHGVSAEGIAWNLRKKGIENIRMVGSGEALLEQVKLRRPDIVFLDIEMPGMPGLEALSILHHKYPNIKVIIVSMHDDAAYVMEAQHRKAYGFVSKNAPSADLISAINYSLEGKFFYSYGLETKVIIFLETCNKYNLNEKERSMIPGQMLGKSSGQISKELHVGPRTIDNWRGTMKKKLGARNVMELIHILDRLFMN